MTKSRRRHVECTIPVLPVRSLARSIRFYTQKLGFKLDWGGEPGGGLCSVSRDGSSLMLRQRSRKEKTARVCVWIGLASDRLFTTFRSRGVKVL